MGKQWDCLCQPCHVLRDLNPDLLECADRDEFLGIVRNLHGGNLPTTKSRARELLSEKDELQKALTRNSSSIFNLQEKNSWCREKIDSLEAQLAAHKPKSAANLGDTRDWMTQGRRPRSARVAAQAAAAALAASADNTDFESVARKGFDSSPTDSDRAEVEHLRHFNSWGRNPRLAKGASENTWPILDDNTLTAGKIIVNDQAESLENPHVQGITAQNVTGATACENDTHHDLVKKARVSISKQGSALKAKAFKISNLEAMLNDGVQLPADRDNDLLDFGNTIRRQAEHIAKRAFQMGDVVQQLHAYQSSLISQVPTILEKDNKIGELQGQVQELQEQAQKLRGQVSSLKVKDEKIAKLRQQVQEGITQRQVIAGQMNQIKNLQRQVADLDEKGCFRRLERLNYSGPTSTS